MLRYAAVAAGRQGVRVFVLVEYMSMHAACVVLYLFRQALQAWFVQAPGLYSDLGSVLHGLGLHLSGYTSRVVHLS